MTIKELFKKVDGFNEVAEMIGTQKARIWFAERICGTTVLDGEWFATFADFRKYVRRFYVKEVADRIINDDEWQVNGDHGIAGVNGRALTFEVYIEQN